MFYKTCVRLGDIFGNRYLMYRHDSFQAIFAVSKRYLIIAVKNRCRQVILMKKMLSPNSKTTFFVKSGNNIQTSLPGYCIFGTFYCSLQEVSREKSKTKASLKHSTLKMAMTSFFRKTFPLSDLWKDQCPTPFIQEQLLQTLSLYWNCLKHC